MSKPEVLPVKLFTRENPATKVDLLNCFWNGEAFVASPIVTARGVIGLNVPKYLHKHELAHTIVTGETECLKLTEAGKRWLTEGIHKHLKRHPEDIARCSYPPPRNRAVRATPARKQATPATMPRRLRSAPQKPQKTPR